jgi:hypothetical protein
MIVRELIETLQDFDGDLDVRFDAVTVEHCDGDDPEIDRVKYVEDGFTETSIPSKSRQRDAENAYVLLAV